MSPFKNSPLQSPVFRKPLTLPDCAASDTSSCELNRDSLSGALATPLCETPDSEARDSLSVSRINVDGATTPTGLSLLAGSCSVECISLLCGMSFTVDHPQLWPLEDFSIYYRW